MRPVASTDAFQPRSRKHSVADQASSPDDSRNAAPMTFFLARGLEPDSENGNAPEKKPYEVQSLQNTVDGTSHSTETLIPRNDEQGSGTKTRRRSTVRQPTQAFPRRGSSVHSTAQSSNVDSFPLTPLLAPSNATSPPSSPKSTSTRSIRKSVESSAIDDTGSQAITSSEEEEPELAAQVQDSAPQLIMPSIKMPIRRPFTSKGKNIGRLKILVAGSDDTGKTSLIKSIVQTCEDIVHVDPLTPSLPSLDNTTISPRKEQKIASKFTISEIYASTRPYPTWWSEIEDSKVLRRRKSMGDSVLERNLCFVDTSKISKPETIVQYLEQQLLRAVHAPHTANGDLLGMLSGRGGTQVDVILYLISRDTLHSDCQRIQRLSELANVIPLIAKSDLLSAEDIEELKNCSTTQLPISVLPRLPISDTSNLNGSNYKAAAPYMVSSATGLDETMDASLLMSPDYVQPLIVSELEILVQHIFEPDVMSYLRHLAAKKIIAWQAKNRQLTHLTSPPTSMQGSASGSPIPSSLTNSGVIVPFGSDLSLTTSNSYVLAKLADHTQREERLAQVRLSKWASDLQLSLQRERKRYEKLARGDRAVWLVDRLGEEVRDGRVVSVDNSGAVVRAVDGQVVTLATTYAMHDPLGLLRWNESIKTKGWVALQVVGSFGVVGGLALWLVKTWAVGSEWQRWADECGWTWWE